MTEGAKSVLRAPDASPGVGAPAIVVEGLDKRYETADGQSIHALSRIELSVRAGEFVSFLGPSGCGKSTLLRLIAGLETCDVGEVRIEGKRVSAPRRDASMVFQQAILYPWRTVLENVLLPAEILGLDAGPAREAASRLLDTVGLADFHQRFPRELSGGMQQRVALVRALIAEPKYLLMDEPFGALDAMTRENLNLELLRIWDERAATVLFVTHSISEAVFLSDRVVVLSGRPGRIVHEVEVDLPRPRDFRVMATPRFGELTLSLRELLTAKGNLE